MIYSENPRDIANLIFGTAGELDLESVKSN